jgi:putative ABC transport system substrate-binding protein
MRRREFIAGVGGVAAIWPVAALTQQSALPMIGFLSVAAEPGDPDQMAAFRQGLKENGYVEGRNVGIVYRWGQNQYALLPSLAADLVHSKVAVIVTAAGAASAMAAKSTTTTIPIVFQFGSDPVALGLVASLNRPGGNITGTTFLTSALFAKRLDILHQAVPVAATIGFLVNPGNPDPARIKDAVVAARTLGLNLLQLNASHANEIETAFANFAHERVGALLVDSDTFFYFQRAQIVALAARHKIPAIYHAREAVEAGGLMSYAANFPDAYRIAGVYAGRILNGEKPADLPVQQSTKVELVINLKTANALGLTIPETLLATADEVIQ